MAVDLRSIGTILETLNEAVIKPAGYELYDFGGGMLVDPEPDGTKESLWLTTHIIAITTKIDGKFYFTTKGIELDKASPAYLTVMVYELVKEMKDGIASLHEEGSAISV